MAFALSGDEDYAKSAITDSYESIQVCHRMLSHVAGRYERLSGGPSV